MYAHPQRTKPYISTHSWTGLSHNHYDIVMLRLTHSRRRNHEFLMVISVWLIRLPWVRRFLEFLVNLEAPGGPVAPHLLSLLGNHAHPEQDKGTLTHGIQRTYKAKRKWGFETHSGSSGPCGSTFSWNTLNEQRHTHSFITHLSVANRITSKFPRGIQELLPDHRVSLLHPGDRGVRADPVNITNICYAL